MHSQVRRLLARSPLRGTLLYFYGRYIKLKLVFFTYGYNDRKQPLGLTCLWLVLFSRRIIGFYPPSGKILGWMMWFAKLFIKEHAKPDFPVTLDSPVIEKIRFLQKCCAGKKEDFFEARESLDPIDSELAQNLYTNGWADITEILNLSSHQTKETRDYFLSQKCYAGQYPTVSDLIPRNVDMTGCYSNYYCTDPLTTLNAPNIKQILKNQELRDLLVGYMGMFPKLYSANTMVSVPVSGSIHKASVTNDHRDTEDITFLVLFVYWTDVTKENGATSIIPGSHRSDISDDSNREWLTGKAGSAFLVDAYSIHSGNKNLLSPRVATWLRFGSIPNYSYIGDKGFLFADEYREAFQVESS
jgi:hypothetical protein